METDQAELLKKITSFLEEHKIPYMITGAWSVIYYGRPRASHDIDFVVELKKEDIQRILAAIAKLPDEFLVRPDNVREAISKNYQIQKKNLDNEYLKSWVDKLKLKKYFEELNKINLEKYI